MCGVLSSVRIRVLAATMSGVLCCLSLGAEDAEAGFHVSNTTDQTIRVAMTFVFNDHIYSRNWQTLRPGESRELDTGDFERTRRYWLVVQLANGTYLKGYRKNRDTYYSMESSAWASPAGRGWQFTNAHVARQMRVGNWRPLRQWRDGLAEYDVIEIVPKGNYSGFSVRINQDSGPVKFACRTW